MLSYEARASDSSLRCRRAKDLVGWGQNHISSQRWT